MGTMWGHGLRLLAMAALLTPGAARADLHKWEISEVFTNADGSVQFIEFFSPKKGQEFLATSLDAPATIVTNGQSFLFLSDLPNPPETENRFMLIATPAFAALPGAPTPDYTIPAGFFSLSGGLIDYSAGADEITLGALPTNGTSSVDRNGTPGTNSPTNFAGASGSIDAAGGGGVCGDGTLDTGEDCDDGNGLGGDCCSSTCSFETTGSVCNDSNACTQNDSCNGAGTCTAGSPLVCNDSNACTNDSCNAASGCVFANNTNSCSDGNMCTSGDTCAGGSCLPGSPLVCNDANACTNDSCNAASGCVFANNTNSCSDGNMCTSGDTCAAGICQVGGPLQCDDGDPCTAESCDEMLGCTTTYVCSETLPTSVPNSSNGSLVVMGLALLGAAIFLTARTRERD